MKIRAFAINENGGRAEPFSYERMIRKNDVLVRITHCGIATGDIQFMNNDWGDTKFPLVPGHEIVGIIEETGEKVTAFKKGDRVGVGYQQEACFECQFCNEGNEQFCDKQKVIGVDCFGGLAEYIVVDARFTFKLPSKLDSAKSVPLLSSGLTVYSAIANAKLRANSKVAVLGVGGLGQLAIQFLGRMGHMVSGFTHSPEKREIIIKSGAEYINSANLNHLAGLNRHFDFILSTINVNFELDPYLKMLKPQGKFCLVAAPLKKVSISGGLLYDCAQRTIYGNYVGSRENMISMLSFSEKFNIECNVEIMPFSKMNEAIEMVRMGMLSRRLVLENL